MSKARSVLAVVLWAGILVTACSVSGASISISINPSIVTVSPDTLFTVYVWKDAEDIEFDGYQTVITFDPEMIELVSAAEEYVMTDSCWNRWWFPDPGADSIFISHVLMCGGITVTGPGALSSLTFRALDEGTTVITCDYFWLTYQGYRLDDIAWHDGLVNIGMAGVGPRPELEEGSLRIEAYPNPGRSFNIRLAGVSGRSVRTARGTLDICDARGQIVSSLLSDMPFGDGDILCWDGRCRDGSMAAPGAYFIKFTSTAGSIRRKVILLR